jgi:hypothetical protein
MNQLNMSKSKITGYWTFFCNPKYWSIDEFLLQAGPNFISEYRIATWQQCYFEPGQLGLIRVGVDNRNKSLLQNRTKLKKGIYAIVEVLGFPVKQKSLNSDFKIEHQKCESERFVVPIKYIRNYLSNPILLVDIENDNIIRSDPYLLTGMRAASMPLLEDVFNRVLLYGEDHDFKKS